MTALVELRDVSKTFVDGDLQNQVLRNLSLEIRTGEFLAVTGPSGAGKSTILNLISGLDLDYAGQSLFLGTDLKSMTDDQRSHFRNQEIGFIFQAFHLLSQLTVLENVCVPAWVSQSSIDESVIKVRAKELLASLGLADKENSDVTQLSGGERQRVAIARAVINQPKLVLADEPTGNLDPETTDSIVQYFENIVEDSNCSLIVVTHDDRVSSKAHRVLRLMEGQLA
ncbi:MAG: ABC transporter ATP-binding protein [Myxococcota bacterium]|nr:ABC transporter ATP-binding protein [Myxococcota bacterium]